jgi:hypothetical protein
MNSTGGGDFTFKLETLLISGLGEIETEDDGGIMFGFYSSTTLKGIEES